MVFYFFSVRQSSEIIDIVVHVATGMLTAREKNGAFVRFAIFSPVSKIKLARLISGIF